MNANSSEDKPLSCGAKASLMTSWHDIVGMSMNSCLVAVLDIMGFSNLIKKNAGPYSMQCVSALIHAVQEMISHVDLHSKKIRKSATSFVKNKMIVFWFSDTLVLVLPTTRSTKDREGFLNAVKDAALALFKDGLPVRGCIDYGDCLYNESGNFMLGEPFVNAHEESERISFAGVVLTDRAYEFIDSGKNNQSIRRFAVPVSERGRQIVAERNCLRWCNDCDLVHDEILRVFSDHEKDLNDRVLELIENTSEVLKQQLSANYNLSTKRLALAKKRR